MKYVILIATMAALASSQRSFAGSVWVCIEGAKTFTVAGSDDGKCPSTIQGAPVDSCYQWADPSDGNSPCLDKQTETPLYTLATRSYRQVTKDGTVSARESCTYFTRNYNHNLGGPDPRPVKDISCSPKSR